MIHRMFTDEPAHSRRLITDESQGKMISEFLNHRMYPQSYQLACKKKKSEFGNQNATINDVL